VPNKPKRMNVSILKCPHGYWAVAIENTRITGLKCCGTWNIVEELSTSASDLRELVSGREEEEEV